MEVCSKGNSEGTMRSMGIVVRGIRYSSVGRACRCNKVSVSNFGEWFKERVGYPYPSCEDNELISNLLESYITANEEEEKLTVFGIEYDSIEDFKEYWNFDSDDYSDYCKTHNIGDADKKESLIAFIKAGRPKQTLSYGGAYFACIEDMCDFYKVDYQEFFPMLKANYTFSDIVREFNKYVNIQNVAVVTDPKKSSRSDSIGKSQETGKKDLPKVTTVEEVKPKPTVMTEEASVYEESTEEEDTEEEGIGEETTEEDTEEGIEVADSDEVPTVTSDYESVQGTLDVSDTVNSVKDICAEETESSEKGDSEGKETLNTEEVVTSSPKKEEVESVSGTDKSVKKDSCEEVPATEKVVKAVTPVSSDYKKPMSMSEYLQRRKSGTSGVVKNYENAADALNAAMGKKDKGVEQVAKASEDENKESEDDDTVANTVVTTETVEDKVPDKGKDDKIVIGKPSKSMEKRSKGISEGDLIEEVVEEDDNEKATEELIKKSTVNITVSSDTIEEACRSVGASGYDFKKFLKDVYGLNIENMRNHDLTTYFKYFVAYRNCNGGHPVVYNGKYYDSVDTLCAENEYEVGAFSSYFNLNVQGIKFDKCYDVEVMSRTYSKFVESEKKKECTVFGVRFKSLRKACCAYGFSDTVFYIRAHQIFKDTGSAEDAIRGLGKHKGNAISYDGKVFVNLQELCSAYGEEVKSFLGYVWDLHSIDVSYASYELVPKMFKEYMDSHTNTETDDDLDSGNKVFKFGNTKFTDVKSLCSYFGTTTEVFKNWLKYSGNMEKFQVGYYNIVVRKFHKYLDGRKPKYGVTYPYCGEYFKSVYDLCNAYGVDVDDFTVQSTTEEGDVFDYLNVLGVVSSFDKYVQNHGLKRRDSSEESVVASDVCYVEYGSVVYSSLMMACDARGIDIDQFKKWCSDKYNMDAGSYKDYKKLSSVFAEYARMQ